MRVRTEEDEFEMLVIAVSVDAMSASMSSATSSIRTSFTIEVGEVVDGFQNFFCSSPCRKQDLGEFFRNFSKFFWTQFHDLRHAIMERFSNCFIVLL
jgi:hypothetical protein